MTNNALYYLKYLFFLTACFGTLTLYPQGAITKTSGNPGEAAAYLPLLNGRIWHNRYSKVQGTPYFLSDEFLKGSVSFNGIRYNDLDLKYDIYNDELILRIENRPVIILNKEMVDDFNLFSGDRIHHFINTGNDTSSVLSGYADLLYNGPTSLFVKYSVIIYPLGAEGRYDLFSQTHRAFVRSGTEIIPVRRKRGLMNLTGPWKNEAKDHLRKSHQRIIWKEPSTFVPLLEFLDAKNNVTE
ncbi:MAG: hypothetical protein K0B05_14255 [Bacteroidales bacterium]|nr:hypothetical protein [Bacteroidales bacterium]